MAAQVHLRANNCILLPSTSFSSFHTFSVLNSSKDSGDSRSVLGVGRSFLGLNDRRILANRRVINKRRNDSSWVITRASAGGAAIWDGFMPEKSSKAPALSDVFWPSAGKVKG